MTETDQSPTVPSSSVTAESATEVSARALVLKELSSRVNVAFTAAKMQLLELMEEGDSKKPQSVDGVRLGTVSYAKGSRVATVTDLGALTDWISNNYPDGVELTVTVRPWMLSQIIKTSTDVGAPVGPGGEVDIPGISMGETQGHISARPDKTVPEYVWADALRAEAAALVALTEGK